mmetsp:Transcript_26065/g.51887  ORF Transcript_26065/g.51887 Transcript_26065/m.51887 type:complete len:1028 (-) Transcript_26065:116-3199(-)
MISPNDGAQVRVGVRIRPLTPKESSEGGKAVVDGNAFDRTVTISNRKFTYDQIFHPNVTNPDLYRSVSPPLLNAFLNGYNATVLAYGQTSSGKTFTMGSEAHEENLSDGLQMNNLSDNVGLIPRFMFDIFSALEERKAESEDMILSVKATDSLIDFSVTASFLEVYGEDIYDLVDGSRQSLKLREDSNGEVFVMGLSKTPILTGNEAMDVLNTGTMNRTTASTLMNRTSSRSHAVFTVYLQQTTRGCEGVDITAKSRFTFVDLAGSERIKKTGAEGERAKEGIKINEGLLALGNVINALADDDRLARGEKVHVPYRQSKLTRLLQDALGGNSQTLFLACVSPSDTNASETLSTLQYANRARNIRNAPTRNVDTTALELQRLRALANVLKCELIKHRFGGHSLPLSTDPELERNEDSSSDEIGFVDDSLLLREDVASYMHLIDEKVAVVGGISTASIPSQDKIRKLSQDPPQSMPSTPLRGDLEREPPHGESDANNVTPGDVDGDSFDHDPEAGVEIIDQLLEIRRQDQQFCKDEKEGQEQLTNMQGEIDAQEERLIQLRENLRSYNDMKEKYDRLLSVVQSLESEKQALMEQLEKVQNDPTKGCSITIKKQLEDVKANLARARSETRKQQQLYRQAEQEAQKCKVLERKIQEMKAAKVVLIRKQKEEKAKHKEFTNTKTQEIRVLKRKEKNAEKKISKMEAECQRYKANLERQKTQCNKLSDKLKETESHLTRLLTKRRHDLNRNTYGYSTRRPKRVSRNGMEESEEFAPASEEVDSIKFLLEKTIADKVSLSQNSYVYESKVVEHGSLLQSTAREMTKLNMLKSNNVNYSYNTAAITSEIKEHEDTVQELQLKIDLIENDLEQLRKKFPSIEEKVFGEESSDQVFSEDEPSIEIISKLQAPVLRSLLWNFLELHYTLELERRSMKDTLARRESAIHNLEIELRDRNEKIEALSLQIDKYQRLGRTQGRELRHIEMIQTLVRETKNTKAKLDICITEKLQVIEELNEARLKLSQCELDLENAKNDLH